jgi:hypothetical protein
VFAAIQQELDHPRGMRQHVAEVHAQRAVRGKQQRRQAPEQIRAVDRDAAVLGDGAGVTGRGAGARIVRIDQDNFEAFTLQPQGATQANDAGANHRYSGLGIQTDTRSDSCSQAASVFNLKLNG